MIASVENTLLGGKVRLLQPKTGYRSAIDPILLAASIPLPQKGEIVDFGCGVGTIGLCLAYFQPDIQITGYEIQKELADLAKQNSKNKGSIKIFNESIEKIDKNKFNVCVMNPPYYDTAHGATSPSISKATAHMGDLKLWLQCAFNALKNKGALYLIVPATRLNDIQTYLKSIQFGAMEVFPIFSKQEQPAKRLIIKLKKHAAEQNIKLFQGLVVHNDDGSYTATADTILKGDARIAAFCAGEQK